VTAPGIDLLAPVIVRRDVEIHRDVAGPYHTRMHVSFGEYQDPARMGIGALPAPKENAPSEKPRRYPSTLEPRARTRIARSGRFTGEP